MVKITVKQIAAAESQNGSVYDHPQRTLVLLDDRGRIWREIQGKFWQVELPEEPTGQ